MRVFTILTICVTTLAAQLLSISTPVYASDGELELSATTLTAGQVVTVSWSTHVPASATDWIGLYRVGTSDTSYLSYQYVRGGSLTFTLSQPGEYEFRYFLNNGYTKVATSPTFSVTTNSDEDDEEENDSNYKLKLDQTGIRPGQTVAVTWETPGTQSVTDWIGVYRVGTSDTSYLSYQYVRGGSLTFTLSQPGEYEFRYFLNNGYTKVATSPTLSVTTNSDEDDEEENDSDTSYKLLINNTVINTGDAVNVRWETSGTQSATDWIGLYRVGSSDAAYLSYQYVRSSSLTFTLSQVGEYEFRYFLNNGYMKVATSPVVSVVAESQDEEDSNYRLTTDKQTYAVGDVARVSWSAPQYQALDWIGVYTPGAPNTAYLAFEYTDPFSQTETFRLTSSGVYEFRFFTRNTYTLLATSETISVVDLNDDIPQCVYDTSNIINIPPPNGPIIAFGDSLTFGTGATAGENYVDEMERQLGVSIINEGVPGDTTRDALLRLNEAVLQRDPSAVIVFLGGNDEIRRFYETLSTNAADTELKNALDAIALRLGYDWQSVPLISETETFANLTTIIERVQDTGAAVILVGFTAPLFNADLNEEFRIISENTASLFVSDIYSGVFGRPQFMSDLVHPNNAGYDIFANRIAPALACTL